MPLVTSLLAHRASAPEGASAPTPESQPIFLDASIQRLAAQGDLKTLAQAVSQHGSLNHCPECFQWCTSPAYLSRHAVKAHPQVAKHQPAVLSWLRARGHICRPCEFCHSWYKVRPPHTLLNCPVLWICGHLFARFHTLQDSRQLPSMATFDQSQLEEAKAELAQFGKMMAPAGALPALPSTGPPSTAEEPADMDQDKEGLEKRSMGAEDQMSPEATQAKFAKGESKGDRPVESGSGKGRQEPSPTKEIVQDKPRPSPARRQDTPAHSSSWNPQSNRQGQSSYWQRQWPNRRDNRDSREDRAREQEEKLKELLVQVARLAVRLEDQLAISNLDCEFILFFQTRSSQNPWSITDSLYQVGVDWKRQKEQDPSSLSQPMRNVMLYCVLNSILTMMRKLEDPTQEDVLQRAKELHLTEGTTYVYMRWNQEAKAHEKDTMEPLEHTDAVRMVTTMMTYTAFPDVVGRFHALRPLTQNLSSEVIPFLLTIQNRSEASQEMYKFFRRLCRNSVTHLVGMTIRPSKLGRSPLAQQVDRMMQRM